MTVNEIKEKIIPILEESGVGYAGVFGSTARGDNMEESDIDILISMQRPIGVYEFIALQYKLEEVLGKKVDLVTKNSINKYIKPYVEEDLVDIYERR